ncbi:MAG TPA: hypothetical protein DHU56_08965 [Marinobacter sp.]|nr:hypothetical protein [Marinobacter sp.]
MGYSLNDTIVVYDRIRENIRKSRIDDMPAIFNESLNQTLSRTLATSGTTLLVLVALLALGGDMIEGFAIALILGVVVGTYSSIYVSANLLVAFNVTRDDLYVPPKEGAEDQKDEEPPEWLNRM